MGGNSHGVGGHPCLASGSGFDGFLLSGIIRSFVTFVVSLNGFQSDQTLPGDDFVTITSERFKDVEEEIRHRRAKSWPASRQTPPLEAIRWS